METVATPAAQRTVPRVGFADMLRGMLAAGGMRRDMLTGLSRQYEQYGPVVAQGGSRRFVNLFGPDANRFVLLDQQRIFSARLPWMGIMGRIFPNGLLLMDGQRHQHDRRLMHTAFTRSALRSYSDRMNPLIDQALREWAPATRKMQIFPRYKTLTLDLAARIFVGVDLGDQVRPMNRAFENMVAASMSVIRLRIPGLEFYRGLTGREYMQRFLGDLLPSRRAEQGKDMLSRLAHGRDPEGNSFSDPEILDHMIFLMMAAHDTTTSTLTSLTYELARHPEWQERLRDRSRGLGRPYLGADDSDELPELDWAIHETLRRYPPLPVIPRVATADFDWEGHTIPEGAMVVVSPIHTHHMGKWWTDPLTFDPERFSPERAEDQRHSHSWVPFGGGPHLCLGRRFAEIQMRAIMHQLLLRYRWSVAAGYRMPVQQAPISKPVDGLPVTLEPLGPTDAD